MSSSFVETITDVIASKVTCPKYNKNYVSLHSQPLFAR